MYVYLIIGVIVVYAIYKERQALGCRTIPDGTDCDNANGKAILGTIPSEHDAVPELFDKIRKASTFMDRWVVWRFSIILSFATVIITIFFVDARFPTEPELAIGMFVMSALLYFTMNFYRFHMGRYAEEHIDRCIQYLKT